MIKIVFLYTEIMPYTVAMCKELISENNASILFFSIQEGKFSKFSFNNNLDPKRFEYVVAENLSSNDIVNKIRVFSPSILFISGWGHKSYNNTLSKIKNNNCKVVIGMDTQWSGSIRQCLGSLYFRFFLKKRYDFCWVSGYYQYELARAIGFKRTQIIKNLYCADLEKFKHKEISKLHKNIIYVGRIAKEKNINLLIDSFKELKVDSKYEDWTLTIVGGEKKSVNNKGISYLPFLSQEELSVIAQKSSVFCLPSLFEPWGLVVHEFTAMGLALLVSEKVGASTEFMINGYNGYLFNPLDRKEFTIQLEKIMNSSDSELIEMMNNSKKLSQRISLQTTSANLLSIIR
ncbi:glycosyltransferase involved in cell wall biosynthesis [Winogradskyella wandonensis]|uniref:Glycosyltransferase involved in cell wall biosynthesis n=1 Tax=Winogradskyella wandonensis TaxID=1442586 RepID=A0A4R1KRX5_9FLAO|nr:glycosyltransferase family 4 protein [Winogradskyella wandonensis]TCK67806.1 glycosyltransferase involved in cell wall biosynthesis [Winogradskyella wandonensis]